MLEGRAVDGRIIRDELVASCRGAKPLMEWIGSLLLSDLGSFVAWVPQGLAVEKLHSLRWGLGARGAFDPRQEAARDFLSKHQQGLALIEDQIALASDGWLRKHDGEVHRVGDVVYHVIRPGREGDQPFQGPLNLGDGATWLHGVLLCPTDTLLRLLVSRAFELERPPDPDGMFEAVWFEAYDGDGYIEWSLKP